MNTKNKEKYSWVACQKVSTSYPCVLYTSKQQDKRNAQKN